MYNCTYVGLGQVDEPMLYALAIKNYTPIVESGAGSPSSVQGQSGSSGGREKAKNIRFLAGLNKL